MPASVQIVVVGSANTDFIVPVPKIPSPGETVLGGDLIRAEGGKGANQAVSAQRLGAQVTLVACLGEDDLGSAYLKKLEQEGVDLRYIRRTAKRPSGVALIFVDNRGQNAIAVAPGANSELSPGDVERAELAIASCQMVLLQLEVPLETVEKAITLAKKHGKLVLLNPAPAQTLPETLLKQIDLLVPNEKEAMALVGRRGDPASLARRLQEMGAQTVVVTLGGKGCFVASRDARFTVPAFPVQAVDATAAGDCFVGALGVALAEGQSLKEAVTFANAAAALSVTKMGAQPSLPPREEVEAFLARMRNLPFPLG